VHRHTQAEEVAARVHLAAHNLLWAHVRGRPNHAPNRSLSIRTPLAREGRFFLLRHLRDAEIEHFYLPARRQHQVGGLDVTMRDAFRMSGVQRVSDLRGYVDHIGDGQWLSRDLGSERVAFDMLDQRENQVELVTRAMRFFAEQIK